MTFPSPLGAASANTLGADTAASSAALADHSQARGNPSPPPSSRAQPAVHIPPVNYRHAQDRGSRHKLLGLLPRQAMTSKREFSDLKPALKNAAFMARGEYAMTAPTIEQPTAQQLAEIGARHIPPRTSEPARSQALHYLERKAGEYEPLADMYLSSEGRLFPAATREGVTHAHLGWDGPIIRNRDNGGVYQVPVRLREDEMREL